MASRQVVLLTPLESPHLQPLPSSHLINLMNIGFPVVDPFSFQTLATCPSVNLFVLSFIHFDGGGVYPPSPAVASAIEDSDLVGKAGRPLLTAELTFRRLDVRTLRRSLSPLSATLTKNQGAYWPARHIDFPSPGHQPVRDFGRRPRVSGRKARSGALGRSQSSFSKSSALKPASLRMLFRILGWRTFAA